MGDLAEGEEMNRTIILRCHTEVATEPVELGTVQPDHPKAHPSNSRNQRRWSPFALPFDCETRLDENKSLTCGFARLLQDDGESYADCRAEILFYDPDELTPVEVNHLRQYVARKRAEVAKDVVSREIVLCTKQYFVEKFLFPHIEAGNLIVGFNLPFDLSRLAADARPATSLNEGWSLIFNYTDRKTRQVKTDRIRRIKITRKDGKIAFIRMSGFSKRRGILPYGRFLDLFTLAWALRNVHYSLDGLARELKIPGKLNHRPTGTVTAQEINYCRQDVRVTAQILNALRKEFDCHPIDRSADNVYSPASIFKAYLQAMGIRLPSEKFKLDPAILGIGAQAYYGGRSEVRIRLANVPIVHTDFISEYPTVIIQLGIWEMLTAEQLQIVSATDEVRSLLARFVTDPDAVFLPNIWKEFCGYALVVPENDIFPIRTEYNERSDENNIGVNNLEGSDFPIWFAIPDLINSILQTGKAPKILEAIRIRPEGVQADLRPVALRGKEWVDPVSGNLFKSLIEAKQREKKSDPEQAFFLKIMANAGYGIFMETTPKRVSEFQEVKLFSGELHSKTRTQIIEDKGKFYCPILAALITAGGRLLLGALEREVRRAGGNHLFCDTDSMAIVSAEKQRAVRLTDPEANEQQYVTAISWATVAKIVAKFEVLNPYSFPGSILKVEKDSLDRQLYGFAISTKRYVLFDERSRIVHASSHGLGHLFVQDAKWDKEADAPEWVKEAWKVIISSDSVAESPMQFKIPAMMRIAITTPKVQMWRVIEQQQRNLPYRLRVKPFNFVVSPIINRFGDEHHHDGFPTTGGPFFFVSPFSPKTADFYELLYTNVHDGKKYRLVPLDKKTDADASPTTLEDVIRLHQLHPESKSLAPTGGPCIPSTRGLLRRTSLKAEGLPRLIGKEVDRRWEQEEDPSVFDPMLVEYRPDETPRITADLRLQNRLRNCGLSRRQLARKARLNLSTIQNAVAGRRIRKSVASKLWRFFKKR